MNFSYIYIKFVSADKTHKMYNGCDANNEQCVAYKIIFLIETLHWCWYFENNHEFLKFYRIDVLIYLHKNLFMHI